MLRQPGCGLPGHDTDYWHKPNKHHPNGHRECYECMKARKRDAARARHAQYRQDALDAYGGQCACCGEQEPTFLAIDHVNNDGNTQRSELGQGSFKIYRWLKNQGYPDGYQVLCHNCNYAKHVRGVCPHKEVMSNVS